eukprot:TRINITY_DN18851_c0_g1_i1.p1 TRINITY_DN18851_c0_g1~~TRINITY_DN18851_c0_g1_i1.p1  ORF type:complete len:470 (+),score=51.32 TRINITY_DN18851_c0_g1_i1:87-1496(+)
MRCGLLLLFLLGIAAGELTNLSSILEDPQYSLFRLAVQATMSDEEIDDLHISGGLLPPDEAFEMLPEGLIAWLFSNPDKLQQVVSYHLFGSDFSLYEPKDFVWQHIPTLSGGEVTGLMVDGKVYAAGPEYNIDTGRNIATISETEFPKFFQTCTLLFPDGLVPCEYDLDCGSSTSCQYIAAPPCVGDTTLGPRKLYLTDCPTFATCQACGVTGASCTSDSQCCGLNNCDGSCCAPVGSMCESADQCCGPNTNCGVPSGYFQVTGGDGGGSPFTPVNLDGIEAFQVGASGNRIRSLKITRGGSATIEAGHTGTPGDFVPADGDTANLARTASGITRIEIWNNEDGASTIHTLRVTFGDGYQIVAGDSRHIGAEGTNRVVKVDTGSNVQVYQISGNAGTEFDIFTVDFFAGGASDGPSQCCIAQNQRCRHTDECCGGSCAVDPANRNHRVCTGGGLDTDGTPRTPIPDPNE